MGLFSKLFRDPGEDEALLEAPPLGAGRAALLWLGAENLGAIESAFASGKYGNVQLASPEGGPPEPVACTREDVDWARRVGPLVDRADAAGRADDFEAAAAAYREALEAAPGSDLLLMSLGICYVQLGEKARGLRFLERAARLSPGNPRIRTNLLAARGA